VKQIIHILDVIVYYPVKPRDNRQLSAWENKLICTDQYAGAEIVYALLNIRENKLGTNISCTLTVAGPYTCSLVLISVTVV